MPYAINRVICLFSLICRVACRAGGVRTNLLDDTADVGLPDDHIGDVRHVHRVHPEKLKRKRKRRNRFIEMSL